MTMKSIPFRHMEPGAKVFFVAVVVLSVPSFAIVLGLLVWMAVRVWLSVAGLFS